MSEARNTSITSTTDPDSSSIPSTAQSSTGVNLDTVLLEAVSSTTRSSPILAPTDLRKNPSTMDLQDGTESPSAEDTVKSTTQTSMISTLLPILLSPFQLKRTNSTSSRHSVEKDVLSHRAQVVTVPAGVDKHLLRPDAMATSLSVNSTGTDSLYANKEEGSQPSLSSTGSGPSLPSLAAPSDQEQTPGLEPATLSIPKQLTSTSDTRRVTKSPLSAISSSSDGEEISQLDDQPVGSDAEAEAESESEGRLSKRTSIASSIASSLEEMQESDSSLFEVITENPGALFWVPAHVHLELSPREFETVLMKRQESRRHTSTHLKENEGKDGTASESEQVAPLNESRGRSMDSHAQDSERPVSPASKALLLRRRKSVVRRRLSTASESNNAIIQKLDHIEEISLVKHYLIELKEEDQTTSASPRLKRQQKVRRRRQSKENLAVEFPATRRLSVGSNTSSGSASSDCPSAEDIATAAEKDPVFKQRTRPQSWSYSPNQWRDLKLKQEAEHQRRQPEAVDEKKVTVRASEPQGKALDSSVEPNVSKEINDVNVIDPGLQANEQVYLDASTTRVHGKRRTANRPRIRRPSLFFRQLFGMTPRKNDRPHSAPSGASTIESPYMLPMPNFSPVEQRHLTLLSQKKLGMQRPLVQQVLISNFLVFLVQTQDRERQRWMDGRRRDAARLVRGFEESENSDMDNSAERKSSKKSETKSSQPSRSMAPPLPIDIQVPSKQQLLAKSGSLKTKKASRRSARRRPASTGSAMGILSGHGSTVPPSNNPKTVNQSMRPRSQTVLHTHPTSNTSPAAIRAQFLLEQSRRKQQQLGKKEDEEDDDVLLERRNRNQDDDADDGDGSEIQQQSSGNRLSGFFQSLFPGLSKKEPQVDSQGMNPSESDTQSNNHTDPVGSEDQEEDEDRVPLVMLMKS